MWGYGYNMMGWGWLIGVGLLIVLIVAGIMVYRLIPGWRGRLATVPEPVATIGPTPRLILDERYAKGDLTTEEYLERVRHLGSA